MKLLQVPTSKLEQRIKEELEVNPALEEDNQGEDEKYEDEKDEFSNEEDNNQENEREYDLEDYLEDDTPDYKLKVNNHSSDDEEKVVPIAQGESFQEILIEQLNLRNLSEKHKQVGAYIIGNLDEDGYLRREIDALVDDLAFSQNISITEKEVEKVLQVVQQLDPPGIGARTLQECLLLQLRRNESETLGAEIAILVLEKCFEEFTKKHYDKIMKKLHIDDEDLKEAIDEIVKLNPKPGGSLKESAKSVPTIIPDFFVHEAIQILQNSKPNKEKKFQYQVEGFGTDLQSEHERYLVEKHFKKPVILIDYPKEIKAFYMRQNEDGKTVRAMDILFPGIGEIVGGSQREERLELLEQRMKEMHIPTEEMYWYLDTRRFGTAPHAGFGLGFERLVLFVTGMTNIRDVIPFPRTPKNCEF